MSTDTLDKEISNPLIIPCTLSVDELSWKAECQKLKSKAKTGSVIIILICLLVSIFAGFLILSVAIPIVLFMHFSTSKKFNELQNLGSMEMSIDENKMTLSNYNANPKLEVKYSDIKSLTKYNWGIELETKQSNKKENKIYLPNRISQFDALKKYLDSIIAG